MGWATTSTGRARCSGSWSAPAAWAARAATASTSTRVREARRPSMSPDTIALSASPAFDLGEDQRAVREMVRDFAESEIRPIAMAIDETHDFPVATVKKMGELGLMGLFVPDTYGGAGLDYISYVIAVEELSRVCAVH